MANTAERLQQILARAAEINTKATRSADDTKELEGLLAEGHGLRAQMAQDKQLAELQSFAGESAGMLPMAGGAGAAKRDVAADALATAVITPAGETIMTQDANGRIDEHYGEGVYDPKVRSIIAKKDYRDAFRAYMRTPAGAQVNLSPTAMRTLQEGADTAGGFVVPEDMLNRIIAREPTPTRVAGRVTQLQTSRDALTAPKVVYTADDIYTTGMRITWTGEVPASSTAMRVSDPVFGQLRVPVYTAMMSIPVTNDMIEDSSFPLVSWLSGKFSETIDLLRDNMILNGSGQGQPEGILAAPGVDANQPAVIKSGVNGSLGSTDPAAAKYLTKIAFSLPEQYDENAAWVFNKTSTGLAIGQLQDSNGRILWGAGLQDSGLEADIHGRRLLGYPVVFSGFAPNVAGTNYPLIFGDLKGYYLVNRIGFSVQVLREIYAETNQVLILGRIRFGGVVAEPWKIKVGQVSA